MKEVIIDPEFVSTTGDSSQGYSIKLCDEHDLQLLTALERKPELELTAFHVITKLAVGVMGTVNVTRFGCPICALQKFDYINELAPIILRGPRNGN